MFLPAEGGEAYAANAAENLPGTQVTVTSGGHAGETGTVVAAEVAPDGAGMSITVKLPETFARLIYPTCRP